jgi:hypothetical protein
MKLDGTEFWEMVREIVAEIRVAPDKTLWIVGNIGAIGQQGNSSVPCER